MLVKCLEPVIDKNCKVLILGSMPSVISRKAEFYYANPTNRFWKIMSEITGADFTVMTKEEKIARLLENHIALYDVFSECEIQGSADGRIRNAMINDIPSLIQDTDIKTVFITSKKAYDAFNKKFRNSFDRLGIKIISLPSPSSANRSKYKTDDSLAAEWKRLFVLRNY